jgi:hypothetical protein
MKDFCPERSERHTQSSARKMTAKIALDKRVWQYQMYGPAAGAKRNLFIPIQQIVNLVTTSIFAERCSCARCPVGARRVQKPDPTKMDLKNSPHYVNDPHATVVKKPPEFGGGYSAFTGGPEGAGTRFLHI